MLQNGLTNHEIRIGLTLIAADINLNRFIVAPVRRISEFLAVYIQPDNVKSECFLHLPGAEGVPAATKVDHFQPTPKVRGRELPLEVDVTIHFVLLWQAVVECLTHTELHGYELFKQRHSIQSVPCTVRSIAAPETLW